MLKADWIETPLGAMQAVVAPHAPHLLEFVDRKALRAEFTRLRERTPSPISFGRLVPTSRVEAELRAYFDGRSASFSTPLAGHGSAFARRIWQEKATPPSTTCSYAEVAAALGHP